MFKQLKAKVAEHEGILTGVLIGVGAILILVACFGKTEHKVAAMVYIIF